MATHELKKLNGILKIQELLTEILIELRELNDKKDVHLNLFRDYNINTSDVIDTVDDKQKENKDKDTNLQIEKVINDISLNTLNNFEYEVDDIFIVDSDFIIDEEKKNII